jgi:hypothetical protein
LAGAGKVIAVVGAVRDYQERRRQGQGQLEAGIKAFVKYKAGALGGAYDEFKSQKEEGASDLEAGASALGGFAGGHMSGGTADTAINLANTALHMAGAPEEVTDASSVVASATPSSFGAAVASAGSRALVNTVRGDKKANERLVRDLRTGKSGAALQGYATAAEVYSKVRAGANFEEAIMTSGAAGKDTAIARAGTRLGGEAYQFVNSDLPEAEAYLKKDIGKIKTAVGLESEQAEWPTELADQQEMFHSLVESDVVARSRVFLKRGDPAEALRQLKKSLAGLESLFNAMLTKQELINSPDKLRRISARQADVRRAIADITAEGRRDRGGAAASSGAPTEAVGASPEKDSSREIDKTEVSQLLATCQVYRGKEETAFAAIETQLAKQGSWIRGPDYAVVDKRLTDLASMYAEWTAAIVRMKKIALAHNGNPNVADRIAPNRSRWQDLFNRRQLGH